MIDKNFIRLTDAKGLNEFQLINSEIVFHIRDFAERAIC